MIDPLTRGALLGIIAACAAAVLHTVAPLDNALLLPPMWFEAPPAGVALRFLGSLVPALPFCIFYGIVTGAIFDDRTRGAIFKAFTLVAFIAVTVGGFVLVSPSLGSYILVIGIFQTCAIWCLS